MLFWYQNFSDLLREEIVLKAVYYTVEVHNFDLQEKTTSTLK